MKYHTGGDAKLGAVKVAITLDEQVLRTVDCWVAQGRYPNRSQAIQAVLREKMAHWKRTPLADELARLDLKEERTLATERMAGETWRES